MWRSTAVGLAIGLPIISGFFAFAGEVIPTGQARTSPQKALFTPISRPTELEVLNGSHLPTAEIPKAYPDLITGSPSVNPRELTPDRAESAPQDNADDPTAVLIVRPQHTPKHHPASVAFNFKNDLRTRLTHISRLTSGRSPQADIFDGSSRQEEDVSEQYWRYRLHKKVTLESHSSFPNEYPAEITEAIGEEVFEVPSAPLKMADVGAWDTSLLRALLNYPLLQQRMSNSLLYAIDLEKPPGVDDLVHGTPIEYRTGKAQALPLESGSLDFLTMVYVLNYIDFNEWPQVLHEINRCLRDQGRAALILHHPESPYMSHFLSGAFADSEKLHAARAYLAELEALLSAMTSHAAIDFPIRLERLKDMIHHRPDPETIHLQDSILDLLDSPQFWPAVREQLLAKVEKRIKDYAMGPMMLRLKNSLALFSNSEELKGYFNRQQAHADVKVLREHGEERSPLGYSVVISK